MLNKGHRGSSLLVLLLNASMHKHVEVEIHTQTLCDAMQTMGLKKSKFSFLRTVQEQDSGYSVSEYHTTPYW